MVRLGFPNLEARSAFSQLMLAQLQERGYAEKHRSDGRRLRQVDIVFDPETRNIEVWETD